jgi:hypothetical protein
MKVVKFLLMTLWVINKNSKIIARFVKVAKFQNAGAPSHHITRPPFSDVQIDGMGVSKYLDLDDTEVQDASHPAETIPCVDFFFTFLSLLLLFVIFVLFLILIVPPSITQRGRGQEKIRLRSMTVRLGKRISGKFAGSGA